MQQSYDLGVVRYFAVATVLWGIVGMGVGLLLAAQLAWPVLNFDVPWLSYGRIRPLHTNAVIFAFGGCALMASALYVVQRTCRTRLNSVPLAWFVFWGWQTVILAAAITLPLGITTTREYAELEWPIDILIAVVWISFGIVFFGTIARRTVGHIYVANWFFGALIVGVAVLHVFNSLALPVSLTKSYPLFAGSVDAMVQWWYGHNAVGFFLTAGFLGIMYYFVPSRRSGRFTPIGCPIVHFWALISMYMWAGPHHLHYTALPDWAQSLGMVMSLMLLAPSWGGMINGIMTLSGAWHKLRDRPNPPLYGRFSLSFYGMSTFEGPMMSIKHRELPFALHGLDHRPRALWRSGLGGDDFSIGCRCTTCIPKLLRPQGRRDVQRASSSMCTSGSSTIGTVLYIAATLGERHSCRVSCGARYSTRTAPSPTAFVESVVASYPGWTTCGFCRWRQSSSEACCIMAYNTCT